MTCPEHQLPLILNLYSRWLVWYMWIPQRHFLLLWGSSHSRTSSPRRCSWRTASDRGRLQQMHDTLRREREGLNWADFLNLLWGSHLLYVSSLLPWCQGWVVCSWIDLFIHMLFLECCVILGHLCYVWSAANLGYWLLGTKDETYHYITLVWVTVSTIPFTSTSTQEKQPTKIIDTWYGWVQGWNREVRLTLFCEATWL